jgi:hypothetical protein
MTIDEETLGSGPSCHSGTAVPLLFGWNALEARGAFPTSRCLSRRPIATHTRRLQAGGHIHRVS